MHPANSSSLVAYLFFLLFLFGFYLACTFTPQKSDQSLVDLSISQTITITNNLSINNQGGHIQGIQQLSLASSDYYVLTGSSSDHAYYVIADANTEEVIAVDTFLTEPFRHAGGFQIYEDLLAVGIEDNHKADKSKVLVYRIIDQDIPQLTLLKTIDRKGAYRKYTAGCVAITQYQTQLLLAVGNWDTKNIDFYSIAADSLERPTSNFQLINSLDTETLDRSNWVEKSWHPYQNINFFTDLEGQIYLLGFALDESNEQEVIDVFSVAISASNEINLRKRMQKRWPERASTTFKNGGGIYLDKDDQIIVVACGRNLADNLTIDIYRGLLSKMGN